jgi:hypothetical protein
MNADSAGDTRALARQPTEFLETPFTSPAQRDDEAKKAYESLELCVVQVPGPR